jgi:hypothetical protein
VIDRFNDERLRCKEQAPCAAYLSLKNRELQLVIDRPRYVTVSTSPCSAAITFTKSAVRRILCIPEQTF